MSEVVSETWHGTATGYQRKGCRCDKCRAYNRDLKRSYRARHPGYDTENARPYRRAMSELIRRHGDEMDELVAYYREHPGEMTA